MFFLIKMATNELICHYIVSPNLAFLCRNLDYKPYSIKQSNHYIEVIKTSIITVYGLSKSEKYGNHLTDVNTTLAVQ